MATQTTRARIDRDTATVTRTVFVRALLDSVWETITDPDLMAEWLADSVRIDELTSGAAGLLTSDGHGDTPIGITEVEPRRVFAFLRNETGDPIDESSSTLSRLALAEETGGTVLSVSESGFAAAYPDPAGLEAALESSRRRWDEKLDALAAVLEKQDSQ